MIFSGKTDARVFLAAAALLVVSLALPLHAKTIDLSPVKMVTESGDRLAIRGFQGNIDYIAIADSKDITVQVRQEISESPVVQRYQDEWQFSFRRDGNTIVVAVDGPQSKQAWNEILLSEAAPSFHMKITGPSLPLFVNWQQGKVMVQALNAEAHVTQGKGETIFVKGEGDLFITNQEGAIRVSDRKGEVKVDSYLAKVEISNIEGKLELDNFTGESRITNIDGNVNLTTYRGLTKVADVHGRLEFKNGNSPLHIEKLDGELRGRSAQGAVFAEVKGEPDVRVESAEGNVNLRLPASSGAWVNLGSAEGSMAAPVALKATRLPNQQIRTGRLRGGGSGGSVFVRTTTGDIRIR